MTTSETAFTKIVSGQASAAIIYEDATTLAFLDHNPVTRGHCLVISKEPIDHLDDCSPELYASIFSTVQHVSKLQKARFKPERIALVVHGYEIPHAHVHVIPLYNHEDLKFPQRPEKILSKDELAEVLADLKATNDDDA